MSDILCDRKFKLANYCSCSQWSPHDYYVRYCSVWTFYLRSFFIFGNFSEERKSRHQYIIAEQDANKPTAISATCKALPTYIRELLLNAF